MEEAKAIPTDKLVRTYIKIRDARKELSDKYGVGSINLEKGEFTPAPATEEAE